MPHISSHILSPQQAPAQPVRADANAPWANPWAVFWRRKHIILSTFLLGTLATVALWKNTPEVYRSSAQLLLIVGAGTSEHAESVGSVEARAQSHIAQLKSPLVLKRIVKQVFDTSYPDDNSASDAHERLRLDHKQSLLKMSFAASSPELSRAQLTEIISGYQGYLHYTPQTNHKEAVAQLRREILQAEEQLAEYQHRRSALLKPTPFAGTNRDIHEQIDERLRRLNEDRQGLKIRKTEIERALANQPPAQAEQSSTGENLPALPELGETAARDLYALELRHRMMASRARVMRPELERAANETDQARELYIELGQSATLLNELIEVEGSIEALDKLLVAEQRLAEQWSTTATKANQLKNAINQYEQTLSSLRRQLQRRTLSEEMETCQLQVIAPPKAGIPLSLKSTLLYRLLPGVFGSLLLGVSLGCALEFFDRGFHSPAEIPDTIGAPLAGEIPFITSREATQEHSAVGGLVANYKISHSEFADQFRKLRTVLLNQAGQGRGQVLLIATAHSGDGQSVCAANLAASMAQAGKRTLLIDVNMRNPQQHETFGMPNQTGLSDILSHGIAWQKLVVPTLLADVDLLTSGQPYGSPTELLSSPHWLEFLDSVRTSYDFIILDCPAMKENLDLRVLARAANQILMLLRVGKTSRIDAQFLLQELGELSTRIFGVVVNNSQNRRSFWNADPWENYHRMHTHRHMRTPVGRSTHAQTNSPHQPRQTSNSTNSAVIQQPDSQKDSESPTSPKSLNSLAADSRYVTHSLQEIHQPVRSTIPH